VSRSIQNAVEAVEATLQRRRAVAVAGAPRVQARCPQVAAHMPFAGHECAVTRGLETLCNSGRVVTQEALVGRRPEVRSHVPDAGIVRIKARQQRGTCRAAARAVVHRRQQSATPRHAINGGRSNLRAHDAEVGKAHVVGQDQDDVGAACCAHLLPMTLAGSTRTSPFQPAAGRPCRIVRWAPGLEP
jgi:hypothetical protein